MPSWVLGYSECSGHIASIPPYQSRCLPQVYPNQQQISLTMQSTIARDVSFEVEDLHSYTQPGKCVVDDDHHLAYRSGYPVGLMDGHLMTLANVLFTSKIRRGKDSDVLTSPGTQNLNKSPSIAQKWNKQFMPRHPIFKSTAPLLVLGTSSHITLDVASSAPPKLLGQYIILLLSS